MPKGVYPRKREASYNTRHRRVKIARGSARSHPCANECGQPAAEWAQIHGTDGLEVEHYRPLCHKCHVNYDMTDERREQARTVNVGRKRPDLAESNRHRKSTE